MDEDQPPQDSHAATGDGMESAGTPYLHEDRRRRHRRRGRRRLRQVRLRPDHRRAGADHGGRRQRHQRLGRNVVAVEMGGRRRGRSIQPHHAGQGAGSGQDDPRGQDLQDRPHLRGGNAAVRSARLRSPHPRRTDRRPLRQQQDGLQRRVPVRRDRPDRHPVRRPRPYRRPDRQGRRPQRHPLLQRRHHGPDGQRLRPEETGRREAETAVHQRRIWSISPPSRDA